MRIRFRFIIPVAILFFAACKTASVPSSAKKNTIWNKPVPMGDATAVRMPAKIAPMTENEIRSWPHADLFTDSIPGMSLAKAYAFLQGKKADTVLVGVIDSGIDIFHEDLVSQLWTNPVDNTTNNQDEDKNGYTDDIHGWNFLGGNEGQAVYEQAEVTREYKKYAAKFKGIEPSAVAEKDKAAYALYMDLKKEFEPKHDDAVKNYAQYKLFSEKLNADDKALKEKLKKEKYTLADVKALPAAEQPATVLKVFESGSDVETFKGQLKILISVFGDMAEKKLNLDYYGRLTKDDPDNINDTHYGNAYVRGSLEEESHGTHVAGIIMATRNNGKGINGVTNVAKLIAVRAVPNGDEHDKDVALAIKYMVDKGAKVINMSFGKSRSPNPEWVYNAMKYAASKDVLIVRAAGNDGMSIDQTRLYPNDAMDNRQEFTDNVIAIGAITPFFNEKLVGDFSNYGKINVDVFAPGEQIYSTVPRNKYDYKQGTSMATPEVAGVAALIRAYYPELSAPQVKHILMNSGLKVDMEVFVPKSEGKKKMSFSDFSGSGRILNAYNALRMADAMVNGK